jgi:GNAT superfamily N-acetyltransferase
MEIKKYEAAYFENVFDVVHKTISEVYPKYYPKSAVDFYHQWHSKENMREQLQEETVLVLFEDNNIVGTGAVFENDIRRFFILPEYQGKGYGSALFTELEKCVDKNIFPTISFYATLCAFEFYQKNNYIQKNFHTVKLPSGDYLCCFEMEKTIS